MAMTTAVNFSISSFLASGISNLGNFAVGEKRVKIQVQ
jgi:hypothetical protein